MKAVRSLIAKERGGSAVEFALIAPLLVLILFLLIDIGRYSFVQLSLNSAARESVRASSFGLTDAQIDVIANSSSGPAANIANIDSSSKVTATVAISCAASNNLGRTTVVNVTTPFKWVTPVDMFLRFAPNSSKSFSTITLSASGVMVCAN